ncbi:hypothetical protein RRG08_029136 [Elysia crispata]|uniref:Uncharacterized protein n=1 Tax=Elysia crispata TaxID=231223 RepID=A0AAE0Y7X0_9GAST|nr:hypothetical protein RRG08_029136 [Elysia crispata]
MGRKCELNNDDSGDSPSTVLPLLSLLTSRENLSSVSGHYSQSEKVKPVLAVLCSVREGLVCSYRIGVVISGTFLWLEFVVN